MLEASCFAYEVVGKSGHVYEVHKEVADFVSSGHKRMVAAGHDWGPIRGKPEVDGGECRRCGLIASNAEIACRQ